MPATKKQDLEGRLKRARSWLDAANNVSMDQKHAVFIFLYVAFNALYGRRQYEGTQEDTLKDREEFLRRVRTMESYDMRHGSKILLKALYQCQQDGGSLITNYFLRNSYWKQAKRSKELVEQFSRARIRAESKLLKGDYEEFLRLVLERITVLRNQVLHGCVTYGRESKGLPSLEAGLAVLQKLVPAIYELMVRYGDHVEWPPIPYPRVGSESHPFVDRLV